MNVPRPALIAGIIGTLAFGAVGGAVFDWLTVPLAWLIGAMVITTAAALTGAPLKGPGQLRIVMIGVLGIMLGSAFTSDALDNLGQWLSSLSVLLAFIVAVTTVVALYLVRIGGYDPISAFFSASPGGLATMVVMGGEMGGDERSIALTHSIRVMLTVLVIPFWFRFFHGYEPGGLAAKFGDIGDIFETIFGSAFGGMRQGARRGADLRYTLELSLEQAVHGCEEKIRVPSWDPCNVCDGSGAKPGEQQSESNLAGRQPVTGNDRDHLHERPPHHVEDDGDEHRATCLTGNTAGFQCNGLTAPLERFRNGIHELFPP